MKWYRETLQISTRGKGLHDFTAQVENCLNRWPVREGMCFLFIQHTSASLLISESYDPSARADLEAYMERLAPEGQPWHRHTLEGPDDSPSHMRAMLTPVSLAIPIEDGRLALGAWQGIYLFEHRASPQRRRVMLSVLG